MKKLLKLNNIQKRYFNIDSVENVESDKSVDEFENDNKDLIKIAFSSTEPYPRDFGIKVLEVIGHDDGDMDLTRLNNNAALLFNHDWDQIIGSVQKAFVENGFGYAFIKMSNTADKFKTLVSEGILSKVSFGYEITAMEKIGEDDGTPIVKVKTVPYEISLVSIPADDTVGILAKDLEQKSIEITIEINDSDGDEDEDEDKANDSFLNNDNEPLLAVNSLNMTKEEQEPKESTEEEQQEEDEEETEPKESNKKDLQTFDNNEKIIENINNLTISKNGDQKMKEILALGKKLGELELAAEYVDQGKSLEQFQDALIEKKYSEPSKLDAGSQKELDSFNLGAYIKEVASEQSGKFVGFAKELTQEANQRGYKTQHGGILIPRSLLKPKFERTAGDYNAGIPTGGGNWSYNDYRKNVIDYLYHASIFNNLSTMMPSAEGYGSVTYPIVTAKNNVEMLGENKASTRSRQDTANVTFTPKTAKCSAKYTRELLKTFSVESLQGFVTHGLYKAQIENMNAQFLNGSGKDGNVLGIFNVNGTNVINFGTDGGAVTYAKMVEFESAVGANDVPLTRCGYAVNSKTAGALKSTQKFASFGAPILEGTQTNGYEVYVSNEIKSDYTKGAGKGLSAAAFVNADFVYGIEWDSLEIFVNPYALMDGACLVESFNTFDFQVTRPVAISIAKDIAA